MYDGEIYDDRGHCHPVIYFKCYKSPVGDWLVRRAGVHGLTAWRPGHSASFGEFCSFAYAIEHS